MQPIFDSINQFIATHDLAAPDSTIVVGLSGGPDSVFLLHALHQLSKNQSFTLIAAHLDHQWREDSAEDVKFCQRLCDELGIRLVAQKLNDLGLSMKFNGSKEEWGRKARRSFFQNVRAQTSADVIALAHHADDQQETFFIRLFRGASLSGLTGMKPKNGAYIRPLLQTHKADIISYLNEHQIPYLTDPSNSSSIYLRNRIRNTVLPALRDADARFDSTFQHTLHRLAQTEQFLQKHAAHTLSAISVPASSGPAISINQFLALDPVVQETVLIQWLVINRVPFTPSTAFLDELIRFLRQPHGGTHQIHPEWNIVKQKGNASMGQIGA